MRWVLLVGASGVMLAVAGIALALARWDFSMEGGETETWLDYLPFPMILLGVPLALAAAGWWAGCLAVRLVYGEPEAGPAEPSAPTSPPDAWVPPAAEQIAAVVRSGRLPEETEA